MKTVKDIIAQMFPELEDEGIRIQAAQRVQKTPQHILFSMLDIVDRVTITSSKIKEGNFIKKLF